jgi:inactivated superfamily I helicase
MKRFSSMYGGSKILTQPLQQLIALGRSTYAIELYLKKRSEVLRASSRELIISEEPLSYVRQVSGLFINDIVEVIILFDKFDRFSVIRSALNFLLTPNNFV